MQFIKRLRMAVSDEMGGSKDTCECRCNSICAFRVLDTMALIGAIGAQGAAFNYFFLSHQPDEQLWYLFFGADVVMIIIALVSSVLSYRGLLERVHKHLARVDIPHVEVPMYGVLPFGYITWFLYVALLTAKIALFFQISIAESLHMDGWTDGVLSSSAFKIIVASASVVFILLVNTHHDAQPESLRSVYIADLCKGTTFDIMDTVAFLTILLPEYGLPPDYNKPPLSHLIVALGCINLFLPTFALMKLSLSDFGQAGQPVTMEFLYRILRFVLIDLSYMSVRFYLWKVDVDRTLSVFLIKNILYVLISLRYIIPELIGVVKRRCRKNRIGNTEEVVPVDVESTLQPSAPDVGIM